MKERIGKTAGEIWTFLRQTNEVAISRLPRVLKEKTAVVYQALGWLAREGKVEYRTEGKRTLVSLTESERKR